MIRFRGHKYVEVVRQAVFFTAPEEVTDELVFWIHKNEPLEAQLNEIKENMAYLNARGIYDREAMVRAFLPVVDAAMADYEAEFGGVREAVFPYDIQRLTADKLCDEYEEQLLGQPPPEVLKREDEKVVEEVAVEEVATDGENSVTIDTESSGDKQIVINLNIAQAHLLSALKRGAKAWNQARMRSAESWNPDLRNLDLNGLNLEGIDLHGANLQGASLVGTCLRNANLLGADLREADLTDADLNAVDLRQTKLELGQLRKANLKDARLPELPA